MKNLYLFSKRVTLMGVLFLICSTLSFAQVNHNVGKGAHGISESPTAVSYKGKLYVFGQGRGKNGMIEYRIKTDDKWSLQTTVPNAGMSGSPGAVVFQNKLYLFYQGAYENRKLMYSVFDGNRWTNSAEVPNVLLCVSPVPVVYNNKIYIFHQDHKCAGYLWYTTFNGHSFTRDVKVNNMRMSDSPAPVVYKNKIYVFHQGYDYNGEVWYNVLNGNRWEGDKKLSPRTSASLNACVYNNEIYVFHQGSGVTGKMYYFTYNGSRFTSDNYIVGPHMSQTPATAIHNRELYVFHQYGNNKGYLWHFRKQGNDFSRSQQLVGFNMEEQGYLDKVFGTFTIPSTHNSFTAPPLFYNTNNSTEEWIPFQLEQGIRFIEVDLNHSFFPFNVGLDRNIGVIHGKFYGSSVNGQRDPKAVFREIKDWLVTNPNEVIILKIDSPSGVSYNDLKYFLQQGGLYDKIYTNKSVDLTTMTPRDILNAGKQIMLIGTNGGDMKCPLEGLMGNSKTWGSGDIDNMDPTINNIDKPFYVIAMYGVADGLGYGSKWRDEILNEYDRAKAYFLRGWINSARRPFAFVHDFSTYGDVFEVIEEMNTEYFSLYGKVLDANGNKVKGVKMKYECSDGTIVTAPTNGVFNFPMKIGETITLTPIKNGVEFNPSALTYVCSHDMNYEVDFEIYTGKSAKAGVNVEKKMGETCYPNPFSTHTNIFFESNIESEIHLEIYNLLGESIYSKNYGESVKGMNTLRFEANNMESGVYLYKLKCGAKTKTGRLIKK
ncbi:MAG: T9SS type A sorting domain-containing protein [Hyphomicrobiales bacterium]